ncbi:MAG TPA: hypothetical protein VMT79_17615 [Candidatus Binatia bacterium]|nr:hypothetical protein [Candidatus Binatia bacterium]
MAPSADCAARLRAVPPVTQPPHVKPLITVTTAVAKHNQNTVVFDARASLQRWVRRVAPCLLSMVRVLL